jgi:predicted DNA-binding protein (MmcQ/YjbR family)
MKKVETKLRDHALSHPETYEEFPWGERAIKVKGKVFVFMGAAKGQFSMSVKLPESRDMAHDLPFAEPTHYGLGKHGWVTARFKRGTKPPIDLLKAWIDESYRAVAPKSLQRKEASVPSRRASASRGKR